jgi:hypothetical protein
MYGHIASMTGPMFRPFSPHTYAGRALPSRGRVGPLTEPPAISWAARASTVSVVDMEMTACQVHRPLGAYRWIMYDPSPSSSPAKYAASVGSMPRAYSGAATAPCKRAGELKPSYWKTACGYLQSAEDELALPSLFEMDVS